MVDVVMNSHPEGLCGDSRAVRVALYVRVSTDKQEEETFLTIMSPVWV